jgi:hypothetical protein
LPMKVVVNYLVPFLAFLGIYALLYTRAKRQGKAPVIQWRWLGAILLCCGAAIVLGSIL